MSWWMLLEQAEISTSERPLPVEALVRLALNSDLTIPRPRKTCQDNADPVDRLAALIGTDVLTFTGSGGAMLSLDPTARCIPTDIGPVTLAREVPVTLRIPTFGTDPLEARIELSAQPHHLEPSVLAADPGIEADVSQKTDSNRLYVQVTAQTLNRAYIDLVLSGHRLGVSSLSVHLPHPQGAVRDADPLDVYGDPLARYTAEASG